MNAETTGTLSRVLARIHARIWKKDAPPPPAPLEFIGRTCYACRGPLNAGAFAFEDRLYCDQRCAPTYARRKAKEEEQRRIALEGALLGR